MRECSVIDLPIDTPFIELETTLGMVDLHNFADFSSFLFATDGTVRLTWEGVGEGRFQIGSLPISRIELEFSSIIKFAVVPRDVDTPAAEDRTVEFIEAQVVSSGGSRWRFVFSSAMEIIVEGGNPHVLVS